MTILYSHAKIEKKLTLNHIFLGHNNKTGVHFSRGHVNYGRYQNSAFPLSYLDNN